MQEEAVISMKKLNKKIISLKTKITTKDDYLKEFLEKLKKDIYSSMRKRRISATLKNAKLPERIAVNNCTEKLPNGVLREFMNTTFQEYFNNNQNLESVKMVEEVLCFYLYINELFRDIVVLLEISYGVIPQNIVKDCETICGKKRYANDVNNKCLNDFQVWLQENINQSIATKSQKQKECILNMITNAERILSGGEEISYIFKETIKRYIAICEDEYIRIKYYDYDENRLGKGGVLSANKYFNMNTSDCETAYMKNFHNFMAYGFERTIAQGAKDKRGELRYNALNKYQNIFGFGYDDTIIPPEILKKIFGAIQIAGRLVNIIPGGSTVTLPITISADVAQFVMDCMDLHKLRQEKGMKSLHKVDAEIIASFVGYSKRLADHHYQAPVLVENPISPINKNIQKYIALKYLKEIIRILNIIPKIKFEDIEKEWGKLISGEFKNKEQINDLFKLDGVNVEQIKMKDNITIKLDKFKTSLNNLEVVERIRVNGIEQECFNFIKMIDEHAKLDINQEIVDDNGVLLTRLVDVIATTWVQDHK